MFFIYGKPGCSYCLRAKKLLERKELEYEYIDITKDKEAEDFIRIELGAKTVPVIFYGANLLIGGYDDLAKYFEED